MEHRCQPYLTSESGKACLQDGAGENRIQYIATLAQLVEHPPCKRTVVGSIPTGGSIYLIQFFGFFPRAISALAMSSKFNFVPGVMPFFRNQP